MPGPQSIANGESNKVTVFHTSAKFCCGSQRVNILSFASQEEKLKILCKHLYNYLESNHLKTFKEINIRSLQAVGRQTANGWALAAPQCSTTALKVTRSVLLSIPKYRIIFPKPSAVTQPLAPSGPFLAYYRKVSANVTTAWVPVHPQTQLWSICQEPGIIMETKTQRWINPVSSIKELTP